MTFTFTRTHVFVEFADPFLTCAKCGQPVPKWHDREAGTVPE